MIDHRRCDDFLLHRWQTGCVPSAGSTRRDHTAVLKEGGKYGLLRRKDDLLDEGVSAVFGFHLGEAELQAICFDAGRFTAGQAREWLQTREFQPSRFRTASGR